MNRYIARGLLSDMRDGRRVLVASPTHTESRESFELAFEYAETGLRVIQARGAEKIEDQNSGGSIRFMSVQSQGGRGYTADVLYIDNREQMSPDALDSLIATVCSSARAEVLT